MASIWRDDRTGNWVIGFVYGGKHLVRSCRTESEKAARSTKVLVEETLQMLNTGRLVMPADADPGVWILSGGRLLEKPTTGARPLARLGEVCDAYYKDQLDKADTTLVGESTHINHLKRLLGLKTVLASLTVEAIQGYVNQRRKANNRYGGKVSGKTIKKELTTLMQIWEWARQRGHVNRACPIKDPHRPRKWAVQIPKPEEAEKLMTWDEIERRISRGGLAPRQEKELWKYLFLDEKLVSELLEHVKKTARHPFIYPMFAIAAYTGARRSEICRSMMDDFRFDDDLVVIREEAHHHFKETLASGKWNVIRGFHVLRHSFGAICTRAGVAGPEDDRVHVLRPERDPAHLPLPTDPKKMQARRVDKTPYWMEEIGS